MKSIDGLVANIKDSDVIYLAMVNFQEDSCAAKIILIAIFSPILTPSSLALSFSFTLKLFPKSSKPEF